MKTSDRFILVGVAVAVLVVALWIGVISPKRSELSQLDDQIATLNDSVAQEQQTASEAEAAKNHYDANYHSLVVLGKAVPDEADSASLLVQTSALAGRSGVEFRTLKLSTANATSTAQTSSSSTSTDSSSTNSTSTTDSTTTTSAPTAAPATEASAAGLPIGATVGPAGLPVMPYDLAFRGDFFQVTDFLGGIDSLVDVSSHGPGVDGRLITVDGFTLSADPDRGFPHLSAQLHVTTYVTPADQGLTAGATPAAPPPATSATSTSVPVSSP